MIDVWGCRLIGLVLLVGSFVLELSEVRIVGVQLASIIMFSTAEILFAIHRRKP